MLIFALVYWIAPVSSPLNIPDVIREKIQVSQAWRTVITASADVIDLQQNKSAAKSL